MSNTLEKIIADKKSNVEKYKNSFTVSDLKKRISSYKNYLNFKDKLKNNGVSVVAEIKKASPSAGVIVENYEPKTIAKQYLNSGASCLSILTEENYFKGKLEHIDEVKKEVKLPVLCKDFFIDPYQVYLAKSFGADAILIILSAIDEKTAKEIYKTAEELNMNTIVEVHTEGEARNALNFKNAIIGINNRNLHTFETRLDTTLELVEHIPNDRLVVTESGIQSAADVMAMQQKGVHSFLIGETLLRAPDPGKKLAELLCSHPTKEDT